MNSEQRRRLIGNTLAAVFFMEEGDEWDMGLCIIPHCVNVGQIRLINWEMSPEYL